MEHSPRFFQVLVENNEHAVDIPAWEEAKSTFKDKKFRESINAVIKYINPKYASVNPNGNDKYVFSHGSVKLTLTITDKHFELEAPFLRLPAQASPALLRQVVEINHTNLELAHIILKDGNLTFRYKDRLELAEPYKLYNLIREICRNADYYDDLLVEKFKAEFLSQAQVQPLPEDQAEKCWETFQGLIKETDEYLAYWESKRWFNLVMDPFKLFTYRLSLCVYPQGYARVLLGQLFSAVNAHACFEHRLTGSKKQYEQLKALDKETFKRSLYKSELLMADKSVADLATSHKFIESYLEAAESERTANSHTCASLTMLIGAYYYLDMFIGLPAVNQILLSGLQQAGGKKWQETSEIMFNSFQQAHQVCEMMQQSSQMMGMLGNAMNQFKVAMGQ